MALTQEQINSYRQRYGITPTNTAPTQSEGAVSGSALLEKLRSNSTQPVARLGGNIPKKRGILSNLLIGGAKSVGETLQGAGTFGQKGLETIAGGAVTGASNVIRRALGKEEITQEQGRKLRQTDIFTPGTETFEETKQALEPVGGAQKVGKFGVDVAQFAIPGTKIAKATKGASFLGKVLPQALSSGTIASVQEGEIGKESAIAAGTDIILPGLGRVLRPVGKVLRRLTKNLASGASGASGGALSSIAQNPEVAKQVTKQIQNVGQEAILRKNSKDILNGVLQVRRQARRAFGKAIEKIKAVDIKPKEFRANIQNVLDKYGSRVENGTRILSNVEFDDPKNLQKASDLIDRLSKVDLDGSSLRKLADDIDASKFKTATSDERLAFNAFVKDLSSSLKNAINKSTDVLKKANAKFSQDMQLVEGMESIFGKIKYGNEKELLRASKSLESLFNKKGLEPEIIDKFLTRIGIDPEDFATTEAVRQISNIESKANAKGLSWGEMLQSFTSSIVTPKLVRDAAILTGLSESVVKQLLENTAPTGRALLIKSLIGILED